MIRRSVLQSLFGMLIPVSVTVKRAVNIPTFGPPIKFNGYKQPTTTFDAFLFIADHQFRIIHQFDGLIGKDYICITDGYWQCSYYHDCDKPKAVEAYYREYMLPCCISLWKAIYDIR